MYIFQILVYEVICFIISILLSTIPVLTLSLWQLISRQKLLLLLRNYKTKSTFCLIIFLLLIFRERYVAPIAKSMYSTWSCHVIWIRHSPDFMQVEEANGLISEEYIYWVAEYLVMKRASIEPNFHTLYISFLDKFGSSLLRKQVLRETYRNIKVSRSSLSTYMCRKWLSDHILLGHSSVSRAYFQTSDDTDSKIGQPDT